MDKKTKNKQKKQAKKARKAKERARHRQNAVACNMLKYDDFMQLVKQNMEKSNWGEKQHVFPNDVSPATLNKLRKLQAEYLTESKLSNPSSRMMLQEYENESLHVCGLVSDIVIDKNQDELTRLLIEYPTITAVASSFSCPQETNKRIDSHIWIYLRDFTPPKHDLKISIGDNISFFAHVSCYRGKGDYSVRGYKYGLTDISVINSGIYTFPKHEPHTPYNVTIRSDYPRGDDWVVSIKKCKDGLEISSQPSQYASYKERLAVEQNN